MLLGSESIKDAEGLVGYMKNFGIYPNRWRSHGDDPFGPSFYRIECNSANPVEVLLEDFEKHADATIKNYEIIRFDDVFEDDNSYMESLTDGGRHNLIKKDDLRYGAYKFEDYESLKFRYNLNFNLINNIFPEDKYNIKYDDFVEFMNDWEDYWISDENPIFELNELLKYDSNLDLEKTREICDFSNKLFSLYNEKMNSFGKKWDCIITSQDAGYFGFGRGIYRINIMSRSYNYKSWDVLRFFCC